MTHESSYEKAQNSLRTTKRVPKFQQSLFIERVESSRKEVLEVL